VIIPPLRFIAAKLLYHTRVKDGLSIFCDKNGENFQIYLFPFPFSDNI
jgi:hypothetical protein